MKTLSLIGIGPGGPEYLTMQAVEALRTTDCFFMLEKEGRGKDELIEARRTILARYLPNANPRLVTRASPPRCMDANGYREGVQQWHERKRVLIAEMIEQELAEGERGAFLIWGDPSLYDQTVSLISDLVAAAPERLELVVIPGITAVQALTAAHRIPVNRVGEPIAITTGRAIRQQDPRAIRNSVVMLDNNAEFQHLTDQDLEIYWGAYLGCGDQALAAGPLDEVLEELLALRERLREEKGWIMDTYLLRRR
ncbi:precorrin-6A synthase (deacetylating) [Halochromatium salexigens]|uniref:Precorrin-6A synthase (Deacetylating) n=1 Tax=Halochromatium salexigens TaxID=49447 RepID=A0AAJ0XF14_HALSE|nr:precorrin-6A synthase (deacetylating) [Halochromatium salexigens]MBK5929761.1 precorrin-6A synthase (deacetylating) [Halochromatium salexigens]